MKKFQITQEQVNAILNYLAERPFKEVAAGIQMLNSLPEAQEEAQPSESEATK